MYFENTLNILQHLTRVEQARLGKAVNKTLWNTAPAVVNAYYSRNKNQISQFNAHLRGRGTWGISLSSSRGFALSKSIFLNCLNCRSFHVSLLVFPAGILQPPFYHRFFPRSLNYGGIGVVIGHEITHGFDDKGRLFDKDGNLHRWWKDEAIDGFHRRAQCLIGTER